MLAHVFLRVKKDGEYTNKYFSLQGQDLNGTIPIRVCYFGKPIMEPVMEKVLDQVSKKPKLDEKGQEIFQPKLDENGEPVMQPKKDEDGNEIKKDENYTERVDVLTMYSGDQEEGRLCAPVEVIAKAKVGGVSSNGDKYNYFLLCGDEQIPIEVPDFSTAERPDYRYSGNCRKLRSMARKV